MHRCPQVCGDSLTPKWCQNCCPSSASPVSMIACCHVVLLPEDLAANQTVLWLKFDPKNERIMPFFSNCISHVNASSPNCMHYLKHRFYFTWSVDRHLLKKDAEGTYTLIMELIGPSVTNSSKSEVVNWVLMKSHGARAHLMEVQVHFANIFRSNA